MKTNKAIVSFSFLFLYLFIKSFYCSFSIAADAKSLEDNSTEVTVSGIVSKIDKTPMDADGDGIIVIRDKENEEKIIKVAARRYKCKAAGLDLIYTLKAGDHIKVRGRLTREGKIRPYAKATHYIKLMSD